MESQSKWSKGGAVAPRGDVKVAEHPPKAAVRCPDLLLRALALALTLAVAIMVGVDKESKTVSVVISQSLTLHVPATAKWQYMSAFVYFLVSNIVACSYAAASLVYITVAGATRSAKASLAINVLDTVMMGLLLSASGASAAIGVIAQYGNSHVQWNKVCHMFDSYCHQMVAAFALCLVGSFVFLLLAVLNVMDLHKKAL
ncbi:CASP-like protein 1E1 [Syzygium oleosum]|uniref:CASP-like protein 1E1 n=1 Tax=Syzygium oleosum TaxID=219896 RepID=UPI0024B904FA|nr:CASP-like protein 1E1 [Syzygium oleosum]